MLFKKIEDPRSIRKQRGMNQQEFWGAIGVTQSGGCRYESGRNMPKPTRELLRLVHIEQVDLSAVTREAMAVITYIQSDYPQLYDGIVKSLRIQAGEEKAAA